MQKTYTTKRGLIVTQNFPDFSKLTDKQLERAANALKQAYSELEAEKAEGHSDNYCLLAHAS